MKGKKRKPEVLLQDIFKAFKPSLLLYEISKKNVYKQAMYCREMKRYFSLKNNRSDMINYNPPTIGQFFLTKPFTNLSWKDAEKMLFNFMEIRKFRNKRKKIVPKIKPYEYNNYNQGAVETGQRLWPLPLKKYQEIADRIWTEAGQPKFGKHIIDGAVFGSPITRRDPRYGHWSHILERKVGVFIAMNEKQNRFLKIGIFDH